MVKINMHHHRATQGFTIVELLIVVVVIAILAAITIVAYNGISKRSSEAALLSEVSTAAKKIEIEKIKGTSTYPATFEEVGVSVSSGTEVSYRSTGVAYCLMYTRGQISAYINNQSGVSSLGICPLIGGVSTLAGSIPGTLDGTGEAARFATPFGIDTAPNGDIYVTTGGAIRKITPQGVVTTIVPSISLFATAISVGSDGTLYIAEGTWHRVSKVAPDGTATIIAGDNTVSGFADGQGTAARFNRPYGILADDDGTLYVTDSANNRVRKITPSGMVSTIAGSTLGNANGNGAAALFNRPYGITMDKDKNLYVSDTNNSQIRKITPSGDVTTVATNIRAGGLDFASDNTLYGAAYQLHSVVKIGMDGSITSIAGSGVAGYQNGQGSNAQFNALNDIVAGPNGIIYVADYANYRIRKVE